MHVLSVGINLNGLSKSNFKLNNSAQKKLNNLPFDTVSFTNKFSYKNAYQGDKNSNEYAKYLMTSDYIDEKTPIEEAISQADVVFLADAIDALDVVKYDNYGDLVSCDEDLKDEVVFHCLDALNELCSCVKEESNSAVTDMLSIMLNRIDKKMLLELKDSTNENNILANLVSTNNIEAIETLFNSCSNKIIAKLLLQQNAELQFPIGEYEQFTKSRYIAGYPRLKQGNIPFLNKRRINPKTSKLLRDKVREIIKDESVSTKNKLSLLTIYKPNKMERKSLFYNDFIAKQFETFYNNL